MIDAGVVCVFAKRVAAGRVKSRLAAAIGDEPAAALATAFIVDTAALGARVGGATVVLALDGDGDVPAAAARDVWEQGQGDLGARLERVLGRALEERTVGWAIALGADCPDLPVAHLEAARELLADADAVFVPARDGGYCALAVRRTIAGMLGGVRWGGEHALGDTAAQLRRAGLSTLRTASHEDVDTHEDLARLADRLVGGVTSAPATLSALERLGFAAVQRSSR